MPEHKVGTQEEYEAAREQLLAEEKELTRRGDELTRKRLELPWVAVEKEYSFETQHGTKSLAELFDGRSQLLIYHFMFGPVYEAGCANLTKAETTMLVHFGKDRSQQWTLIRIEQPEGGK